MTAPLRLACLDAEAPPLFSLWTPDHGRTGYEPGVAEALGAELGRPVAETSTAQHDSVHRVDVVEGSRLHAVVGALDIEVSSYHHQALDRMGADLTVSAVAADGIVEAVEHRRADIVAVQWHPEDRHATSQGTVIPDIVDYVLHHGAPGKPEFVDEPIDIVPGTRLSTILGTDRVVGRSGHHQAVDEVGRGLVVAARALDGIVEAVEDPNRFYLGVQWHPEDDYGPEADRIRLFDAFVAAAQRDTRLPRLCTGDYHHRRA